MQGPRPRSAIVIYSTILSFSIIARVALHTEDNMPFQDAA